jgi:hypothetical protein
MSSWKPSTAADPDGEDAWRFRPLAETDPVGAKRLIDRYAPLWLETAGLPLAHLGEVPDTVELVIAETWDPPDGTKVLRFTSWYTGETRWRPDWDGRVETALPFMEEVADVCGGWVKTERDRYGGTPWDASS